MPIVSIILPTYDCLAYLQESVASVTAQTVRDWELIVVDDGSHDATLAWLHGLGDDRIVVVALEHSGNRARVRNAGIARARGEWIAFLDADDRWRSHKLAVQTAYHLAHPDCGWSYTGRTMIGRDGRPLPEVAFKKWQAASGEIVEALLRLEANIALPSVMVQRSLLLGAGGFDETFPLAHDYELWLRLAERARCGCVDAPLVDIRRLDLDQRTAWPEYSLAFSAMCRRFAERTKHAPLERLARTRAAYHAIDAADQFSSTDEWRRSAAALMLALRLRPLSPFSARAAGRLVWAAIIGRASRTRREAAGR
ncbi:MAG TPA: glycosyltransferase [Gemmatimonadaceae bacterium]|nr:glycosyltransferase [Gemmatimonadaceae bacterium]